MEKSQENRFSMYLAVQELCDNELQVFSKLPQFSSLYQQFKNGILEINKIRETQQIKTKGSSQQKKLLKDNLVQIADEVSTRMIAYASITENKELLVKTNYKKSELNRTPDTELRDKCQVLHDTALVELTKVIDYGIDENMLANLKKAIDDYYAIIPKPRTEIINKKDATQSLANTFEQLSDLLRNKVDKLVEILKRDNESLYNRYRSARKVVASGTTKKKFIAHLKGMIQDFVSKIGIEKVKVSIVGKKISATSKKDGSFIIGLQELGTFSLKIEKIGYQSKTLDNVTVEVEDVVNLSIELIKL